MEADHYEVLGVTPAASSDDIRAAYKTLAASQRPPELAPAALRRARLGQRPSRSDSTTWDDERRHRWRKVQVAFDTLMNPRRRALYDRSYQPRAPASDPPPMTEPAEKTLLECLPAKLSADSSESWLEVDSLFKDILAREPDAFRGETVCFGDQSSPWEEVREFYTFWKVWTTNRRFDEAISYTSETVAAAPNRAARRCMEQENEKRRRAERSRFLAELREAVDALRQRDPRVSANALRCAEEAAEREAQREAEEQQRQEERREQRKLAREAEQERWATERVDETASKCASPQLAGSWTCQVCDGKVFQTKQAYDAHLATRRHKRSARSTPEILASSAVQVSMSPCILPDATAGAVVSDCEDEILLAVLLPPAAVDQLQEHPFASEDLSQKHDFNDDEVILVCASLSSEHWCRIFDFFDLTTIALAAAGLLSSVVLREGPLGDKDLWQHRTGVTWPRAASKTDGSTWRHFLRLAAGSRSCHKIADAGGGQRVSDNMLWIGPVPLSDFEEEQLLPTFDGLGSPPGFRSSSLDLPLRVLSCGGDTLVAAATAESSEVRLFDVADGRLRRLPPLQRRRRGIASCLAMSSRSENNLLAVAERSGLVRLEDISGDPDVSSTDCGPVLLWDAVQQGSRCSGLFWLPGSSSAICSAWLEGAALFDAQRPEKPVTVLSCELEAALGHQQSCVLLVGKDGGVSAWDFRCNPNNLLLPEIPGERVTAAAADPIRLGIVTAALGKSGPTISYRDLRHMPNSGSKLKSPGSGRGVLLLRDTAWPGSRAKVDVDAFGDPYLQVSHLTVGHTGGVSAVLSDGGESGCLLSSFVGGPELRPLAVVRSNLEVTALRGETRQSPALVAIARRRGHISKDPPAELRLLSEGTECQASVPMASPSVKPKPKKFFRKRDAGDFEFRSNGGRRGGGR
eukprot:TRINITY_DN31281_c0_g1_i1.p1 TRINITY_DN31281_c0_g1~~TRINITY_DN31281_c0_g1_i1.p1  ORF type:complete len:916 (+),score=165.96 TRINITY_DN31281_c0_g1_i1:197-2944(+)